MIFAVETEERALIVFPTESEAVAYCEGLDVEATIWLFWTAEGSPLQAEFIVPNKRGSFFARSGNYRLVPALQEHHPNLAETLDQVVHLEPNPFFHSLLQVRKHLAQATTGNPDGS